MLKTTHNMAMSGLSYSYGVFQPLLNVTLVIGRNMNKNRNIFERHPRNAKVSDGTF